MNIVTSILERVGLTRLEENKTPTAKIVKSQFVREMPKKVTFEKLIDYHDATPQVQIAVSSYSELITGTELVLSTEDEGAQQLLDEWVRKTNFYDKFEGMVQTLLITGNSLLEKLDENQIDDVSEVDMSTIISKKRNDVGELEYYEQRQQQGKIERLGEGNLNRFIEFNLTHYSKQAWGRSLFYSLAIPRNIRERHTAPLVEILWGMEDAMGAIILNNAYPITTITYPGANDNYLEKEAKKWQVYKPGDKRVQKIKPEIEFFETQPGSKYTDYVEHIEKTVELGTQFPHDIMTGDFTSRASSETTENIVMKKVRGFQRYLCNRLKDQLFDPILLQNGFDPDKVELEITFTTQNVLELQPDQVLKLYTDKAITIEELRDWYRTNTGMDLEGDEVILQRQQDELEQQQQQAQQDQQMKDKVKDIETRISNISFNAEVDDKLQEMYQKIEHKLGTVKEATAKHNEGLANKRMKTLATLVNKLEEDLR